MPRDKLAAMASRANNGDADSTSAGATASTSSSEPTAESNAPKRDKFAALASRSAENATTTDAVPSATSGRDKLAAMASRSAESSSNIATGRGNKLAALAAKSNNDSTATCDVSTAVSNTSTTDAARLEQRLLEIQRRLSRRSEILSNLQRAEEMTCHLLKLAHQTTKTLQDVSSADSETLANLSQAYRTSLQELHPLIAGDNVSELMKPYQNHAQETKQSMYGARVEMRLAKERSKVLQAFCDLERDNSNNSVEQDGAQEGSAASKKRARDETTSNTI